MEFLRLQALRRHPSDARLPRRKRTLHVGRFRVQGLQPHLRMLAGAAIHILFVALEMAFLCQVMHCKEGDVPFWLISGGTAAISIPHLVLGVCALDATNKISRSTWVTMELVGLLFGSVLVLVAAFVESRRLT